MRRQHLRLGPSSLDRRFACLGSYWLEGDDRVSDYESEDARAGSRLHDLIETQRIDDDEPDISEADAMQLWEDVISGYLPGPAGDPEKHYYRVIVTGTEEFLTCEPMPDFGGTPDFYVLGYDPLTERPFIHVLDMKYGAGIYVNPRGNKQLLAYALLVWLKHSQRLLDYVERPLDRTDFLDVRLSVVQPRMRNAQPVRHYCTTTLELVSLYDALVAIRNTYNAVEAGTLARTYTVGTHCKFCKAKSICPAVKASLEEVQYVSHDTEITTHWEQIFALLQATPNFLKELEAVMLAHAARTGRTFETLKIVRKLGNTKWKDGNDAALDQLRALGLRHEEVTKPRLMTPNQVMQVVAKDPALKRQVDLDSIKELTTREDYGYKLAPRSAGGEEITFTSVTDTFSQSPIE